MSVLRQPSRMMAREDVSELDGLLQTGVVVWSSKVSMERFQIFGKLIRDFADKEEEKRKHSVVRFVPNYDVLIDNDGLSEARVTFATAFDLFRFLGVKRVGDLETLIWRRWGNNGEERSQLRV